MPEPSLSVTAIREQLERAFEPNQALVLANVLVDAVALGHRYLDEMSALRGEVRELALAQQRTEHGVAQLAAAQEKLAEAQQRTEHSLQLLARQVGGLSEKLGGSLEDLAAQTLPAVLAEAWNLNVEECGRDTIETAEGPVDVDVVLRGTLPGGRSAAVLGEVKARLTPREVEHFLGQVERLRPAFGGAEVRVVFFGFQAGHEARERARAAGAAVVFSNGRLV
ncbi:MAG: hypothetical protein HY744_05175 [Deltaproteobacteria bacterium]|nr:hypothetical protein [Deltaproteobacteria bacterium]